MSDRLADIKAALVSDAAWQETWKGSWPNTAPPDGALSTFTWDAAEDALRWLVAEVERLKDARASALAKMWMRYKAERLAELEARCEQAEAENARLREQTCATCRHQVTQFRPDDPTCGLTRMTDGVHVVVTSVPCRFLGHGCRAWAALEGDHDD